MIVKASVDGKVVRLTLSRGLAQAWRQNRGKVMTGEQAIAFVERQRGEYGRPCKAMVGHSCPGSTTALAQ